MKVSFPFNIISTTLSATGLALFKFHSLTTFHVFISLFFGIVFLLMYIERSERQAREKGSARSARRSRHFFMQRSNVLFLGVVWFYITNSITANQVHFKGENTIITNLLSCNFVLIALGVSLYRKKFHSAVQERIMVLYVILLCFPMNLLQNTDETLAILRFCLFFLIFNLELYVGKTLRYHTTFKQLVMCSYFVFVVNAWYLVASIPVVLTHFLEIQNRTKRPRASMSGSATDSSASAASVESNSNPEPAFDLFARKVTAKKPRPDHQLSVESEEIRRLLAKSSHV